MTGQGDRPIERLTRAIVLASEAGQWDVVRVLAAQLEALTTHAEPAAPVVNGARTIRIA